MTDSDLRTMTIERTFDHPPEKLWRALTQPHLIADWLMQNDFVPRLGHKFQLRGEWGGTLDCEVLAIEQQSSLSYTWNFANDDPAYALESVVTFTLTLTPAGNGTHLRVEQSGFRPDQKQAYGGAHAGWKDFLGKLDTVVAGL